MEAVLAHKAEAAAFLVIEHRQGDCTKTGGPLKRGRRSGRMVDAASETHAIECMPLTGPEHPVDVWF